jgi:hypothetical protein
MKSNTSVRSTNSVRRGPTLRGGRYRQLTRSIKKAEKKPISLHDEETGQTSPYTPPEISDYDTEIEAEKAVWETKCIHTEKVETSEVEEPIYYYENKIFENYMPGSINDMENQKQNPKKHHSGLEHWPQHHYIESQSTLNVERVNR